MAVANKCIFFKQSIVVLQSALSDWINHGYSVELENLANDSCLQMKNEVLKADLEQAENPVQNFSRYV